ncbi:XRE family transcriptional regulator [Lysinibacillus sp. PLM2]|nr:XRE family transcriptional regulator [Lysinibacillus sp. PLM2]
MAELGTRLKEARLSKGYSLDDLQEITKIQKRYLVGIEEGNYSIMPGTFYVRAFIKQYAEAVGLNSDELLEEFKGEIPNNQPEDVAQSISYSSTRRSVSSRSSSRMMETMPKVIAALFLIVILAVAWFLYSQKVQNTPEEVEDDFNQLQYDQKNPTPTENAPNNGDEENSDSVEAPPVEEEPVDEEPTVTQTISPGEVQSDGESTIYELTGTESMNIRVEVSGLSWVGIRNENAEEQVEDRVYNAGEVVEHDSTENGYARIRLGDANNAKVFVNDEEIEYVLDPSEPGNSTQNIIITFSQEQ